MTSCLPMKSFAPAENAESAQSSAAPVAPASDPHQEFQRASLHIIEALQAMAIDIDRLLSADSFERGWPGISVVYVDGEYRLYMGHELGGAGIALVTGTIP